MDIGALFPYAAHTKVNGSPAVILINLGA